MRKNNPRPELASEMYLFFTNYYDQHKTIPLQWEVQQAASKGQLLNAKTTIFNEVCFELSPMLFHISASPLFLPARGGGVFKSFGL